MSNKDKNKNLPLMFSFLIWVLAILLVLGFVDAKQVLNISSFNEGIKNSPSTVVFPIGGRVYPDGYMYAIVSIGETPKQFYLDIDTGSELTWVQCDAPCHKCLEAPHPPYKPSKNLILCENPFCSFIQQPHDYPCDDQRQKDQCDYQVDYADHGSSLGVVLKDTFHLKLAKGLALRQSLIFGCGYDQQLHGSTHAPFVDGILGLANGKSSILLQLKDAGVTRNVIGHCFSSKGGGYLFLGDNPISSRIVWVPLLKPLAGKPYTVGPVELQFNGKTVISNGLSLIVDSGSTYTYLNKEAYKSTLSTIKRNLDSKNLKDAPEDKTLAVCWKGTKRFTSMNDVRSFFKPLTIRFKNPKNAMMELLPEHYLIVNEKGNVCLAILDGSAADLGNVNIIGDVSMQNRLVIYDNEKRQIGWSTENCDKPPKF